MVNYSQLAKIQENCKRLPPQMFYHIATIYSYDDMHSLAYIYIYSWINSLPYLCFREDYTTLPLVSCYTPLAKILKETLQLGSLLYNNGIHMKYHTVESLQRKKVIYKDYWKYNSELFVRIF